MGDYRGQAQIGGRYLNNITQQEGTVKRIQKERRGEAREEGYGSSKNSGADAAEWVLIFARENKNPFCFFLPDAETRNAKDGSRTG